MTLCLRTGEIGHVRGERWVSGCDTRNCSGFYVPKMCLSLRSLLQELLTKINPTLHVQFLQLGRSFHVRTC